MSAFVLGVFAVLACMIVMVVRTLQRYDDSLYSRLPHDKDLQDLFRCHVQLAHDLEDELTRWVLGELDLVHLVDGECQGGKSWQTANGDGDGRGRGESESQRRNGADTDSSGPGVGVEDLNLQALINLGFPVNRARKALQINGGTVQDGMKWLLEHEDDADIDEPLSDEELRMLGRKAMGYKLTEQEVLNVALAACSLLGLANAVVFLLEQKADVNATIQGEALELLMVLMRKRGLKFETKNLDDSTALHMAALGGHPDLVVLMCQFGAKLSACNAAGFSASQLVSPCSVGECVCVCNKVWSFGCRAHRTRAVLQQLRRVEYKKKVLARVSTICPAGVSSALSFLFGVTSSPILPPPGTPMSLPGGDLQRTMMSNVVWMSFVAVVLSSALIILPAEPFLFDFLHAPAGGGWGVTRLDGLGGMVEAFLLAGMLVSAVYTLANSMSQHEFFSGDLEYTQSSLLSDACSLHPTRLDPAATADNPALSMGTMEFLSELNHNKLREEIRLASRKETGAKVNKVKQHTNLAMGTSVNSAAAPSGSRPVLNPPIRGAEPRMNAGVGVAGGPASFVAAAAAAAAAGTAAAHNLNGPCVVGPTESHLEKELKERDLNDLKNAQRKIALLEQQAEQFFAAGEYEAALKTFIEITGASGALLRWSDKEKFAALRSRQAACSLAIAHSHACNGQQLAAIKGFSDALSTHSDSMSKQEIIDARIQRDGCLLLHVRSCNDAEACAEALRFVQRGVEMQRPATIDSSMWKAWREKDKNLLMLLLDARIEQLRDCKSGSPTYSVGKEKFESALRWCDKMQASVNSSTESSPSSAAPQKVSPGGIDSKEMGLKDIHLFSTEVLLWMAAAKYALASIGTSDINIAACHDALQYLKDAHISIDNWCECGEVTLRTKVSADYLNGILGSIDRRTICEDMRAAINARLELQQQELHQRAVEDEQIQRALEEQRKLEEEAKTIKKKEAEERQRKAREERQRKEMEKKQQQMLDKEEAVRKKAEEAAAKKREAEEKRKRHALAVMQEEQARVKREEEERIKAEAAEKARTEAIQEALARRAQQEKEIKVRELEKEKEKEKEREKATKDPKLKGTMASQQGTCAKGKGQGADVPRGAGAVDTPGPKKGAATVPVQGGGGSKKVTEGVRRGEKIDVQQLIQEVDELVAANSHEQAIEAISRLLGTHGSRLSKEQASQMVEQQRCAILECVRMGASHSFGLALPSLISEVRDFRKDAVDELLIRLSLGEVEEALAVCDRVKEGPFLAGVNLRAEALVRFSAMLEEQGRLDHAVLAMTRAVKIDPRRTDVLQPRLNTLLAKSRTAHAQQQQQQQMMMMQAQRQPKVDQNGRSNGGQHSQAQVQQHQQQNGDGHLGGSGSISAKGSLPHSSLPGLPAGGIGMRGGGMGVAGGMSGVAVGQGVRSPHSLPSSPPGLPVNLDWSAPPPAGGGSGVNGGLQFPFGGNGRGGGGVISMGGMQAAGLPAGSPPGGYAGLSTGYGGLQNPSAFGDNFNDQSSFIVPGNMPGPNFDGSELNLDNHMNSAMLPSAIPSNYFLGNIGSGGLGSGMGAAGAGAGMTGYKQGEELGHTLNNESFSDAFGGGLGGFLGPGGSQVNMPARQRGNNAHPSFHQRSDSMDNCLDEILAMPWLGEDTDAGGGVAGLGGIGMLGVSLGGNGSQGSGGGLGGLVNLQSADDASVAEWSGTGGWSQ